MVFTVFKCLRLTVALSEEGPFPKSWYIVIQRQCGEEESTQVWRPSFQA